MEYLNLFWSFFQIGLFSIGGGYVALPLIQNQVVNINEWLNMTEFADIVTISQMTPGPIAINAASFVGIRVAGISGAITATIGCVTPSFIIVLILAYFYYKYRSLTVIQIVLQKLRAGVVALIASAGLSILFLSVLGKDKFTLNNIDINYISVVIFALSIFVLRKFKVNPIYVMAGAGILGIGFYQFIL